MVQRAFHGDNVHGWRFADSNAREMAVLGSMVVVVAWLGLYPEPVLRKSAAAVFSLQQTVAEARIPSALRVPL